MALFVEVLKFPKGISALPQSDSESQKPQGARSIKIWFGEIKVCAHCFFIVPVKRGQFVASKQVLNFWALPL